VTAALECLRHVGIDWSAHPTEVDARREYERIWSLLGDRTIEDLVDLPLMQDPEARATLDLLTSLGLPALYTDKNLYALSACMAVNLSLEHGNSEGSPLNYVITAMIAGPRFGHYAEGYRFGKLACDLLERRGLRYFGARTYTAFAIVVPWTRPFREGIDPSRRAFQMAKDHGDPAYAALSSRGLSSILLALGHPLDQFELEAQDALEFVQRYGFFLDRLSAPIALARTLRGRITKFGSLDDEGFTERSFEERITRQPSRAFLECFYWIRKLQARFFAGDYASAFEAAEQVEAWYATSPALSLFPLEKAECHFYAGLCRAARCEPVGPDSYATHREALGTHERHLRAWAANCPQNFGDRAALVGAEIARIEGRPLDAMDLYERAITSARTSGFVHNEALAYERASAFYRARGFEQIADTYLRSARACYALWGADGKVRQLDGLYPGLNEDRPVSGSTSTFTASVEGLDLATVIRVSQAVSSEIVLDQLLDTVMRTAMEHAGADRALLFLLQGDQLHVRAEATTDGTTVAVRTVNESNSSVAAPESLLRYVVRTHEQIIVGEASMRDSFATDAYFRELHAGSVACLPLLKQGALVGVLYLENRLASHVFTAARLKLLEVLASQAAVALENTRLYRDLEQREAKIRRLVDANILGVCIWTLEGALVEGNEAFLRMVDYGRDDLVSGRLSWIDLTPGEWREHDERAVTDLRTTGTVQPYEKELLRRDGTRVPVLVGSALFEEGGHAGVAFVLDLSGQKHAEAEVISERTRIARELHDTLLQSFHGVMFRFQAAANVLPDRPLEAKQQLEIALKQGTHAIREGRDAIQGLRTSTPVTNDLAVTLSTLGQELATTSITDAHTKAAALDLTIHGTPRTLSPIIEDDIHRIGNEALRNAFRHARAGRIEVEIRYDDRQFQLRVRDDGQGIDAAVMNGHQVGHFGLPGMRERAELIGGQFEVWSETGMGTEVALTIPAAAVYATPRSRRHFWPFVGRMPS
jgi:PAS domain S-box-containing protein